MDNDVIDISNMEESEFVFHMREVVYESVAM